MFTPQLKLKNVIILLVSSLSVKAVSLWDYVFGLLGLALRQGGFNIKDDALDHILHGNLLYFCTNCRTFQGFIPLKATLTPCYPHYYF
jgi:hypothetical protein